MSNNKKKRSKNELEDHFQRLTDAEKVLASAECASAKDVLRLNYQRGTYPYAEKLDRAEYEHELRLLQIELLKVQAWAKQSGERILAIFEGRDAAGKGGMIKRFNEHLNPRTAHIVALQKPTDIERKQWYFQRYIKHLPTAGDLVFFDRSWYNRAGVERVMSFCDEQQVELFFRQTPLLESMLVNDGIHFYKYWFSVSRPEQLRRFHARMHDPLKHWKLSPIDMASLDRFDTYTVMRNAMLQVCDTKIAPWIVVKSDDKKRARINCLRHYLSALDYAEKDTDVVGKPDPLIIGSSHSVIHGDDE